MKFELKKVTYSSRLSQETNAFAADLYCDGIYVGHAENDGHGGMTMVHLRVADPSLKIKGTTREHIQQINAWIAKQPPKVYPAKGDMKEFSVPFDLEVLVDDLLEAYIDEKHGPKAQLARWCKTKIVFRIKGDAADAYRTLKKPPNKIYTKAHRAGLVAKYGDKLEEIVNETLGEQPQ